MDIDSLCKSCNKPEDRQHKPCLNLLRAEAERRLRLEKLYEHLMSIINRGPAVTFRWLVAEGRPVDFVSENICRFGYQPEQLLSGEISWSGMTHPDDVEWLEPQVAGYIRDGIDEFYQEYRIFDADGNAHWVEDHTVAIRDDSGELTHFEAIILDVTERKELEKIVVSINDRRRREIGNDLHDGIGQELTAMSLMAKTLQDRLTEEGSDAAEMAGRIATAARQAITRTRAVARGLCPVSLNAEEGLRTELAKLAAQTREVEQADCHFYCDRDAYVEDNQTASQIYLIAKEAVTNALRHGRATEIDIELRRKGGRFYLHVTDNGSGDPAHLAKVRNGLGLGIMRYRARMLGGSLAIGSAPQGPGIRITCHLPAGSDN